MSYEKADPTFKCYKNNRLSIMKLFTIAIVSLMITALYGQTAVENSGLTNITLPSPILPDIDSISFNASRKTCVF